MIMDASINVAMEPFRALVADLLPSDQRTLGFSIQTVLIGIGAVVGSWLPYVLTNWFGVLNESGPGEVPTNLLMSFFIGAGFLIVSVLITVFTTKEYSPEEVAQFSDAEDEVEEESSLLDIFKDFKKNAYYNETIEFCSVFFLVWIVWYVGFCNTSNCAPYLWLIIR